jgi:hypothetical protein
MTTPIMSLLVLHECVRRRALAVTTTARKRLQLKEVASLQKYHCES